MEREKDTAMARKGRTVSLVIAGTLIVWMLLQVIGPMVGLAGRYALLFDFAALAALIWAFVNIYQIWRMRQAEKG
ncbi:MAG: DUF5337 domain-containing protein [Cognatishimia activa]|uniref:DUF5337 domain-containing protein n=1 Tax=Cognatishimia activa TaxID=1715691 RepID=A0A975I7C4_9RHOB|nr:DUF5337 domain-containing protein [Cognatishimia activa]QTN35862.1 DUF5337 domain-containing protein [Cognatishimia activa]